MVRERRRRLLQTISWFLLTLLLALFIPDIGKVISVIGGLAACFIFVFPGRASWDAQGLAEVSWPCALTRERVGWGCRNQEVFREGQKHGMRLVGNLTILTGLCNGEHSSMPLGCLLSPRLGPICLLSLSGLCLIQAKLSEIQETRAIR